ncbi:MAG: hypothetical protein J5851_10510 [Oscillospiraceae bacterium]|nr:hypothetical protein [Oscillospiraceae bacterium]
MSIKMQLKEYFNKSNFKDLGLSFVPMILTTGVIIFIGQLIKKSDLTLLQPVMNVGGEESEPSVGRLTCMLLFFALSLLCVSAAGMLQKKEPEKLTLPWVICSLGGTLLWASIGECLWHFGAVVYTDEGETSFINFPRLESIQGVPIFLLCALLFAAIHQRTSFTLKGYAYTFFSNWLGHLCTIAIYPIAMAFGCPMDLATYYKFSGAMFAIILTLVGVLLTFGKTRKETKYYSSLLFYAAAGNLVYAVILGET